MTTLQGISGSAGLAIGKLQFFVRASADTQRREIADAPAEIKRFEQARAQAIAQLAMLYTKAKKELGEENSLLFQIHQMMLEDLDYCDSIRNMIQEEKVNAEYAVHMTAKNFAEMFANMDDDYMKGRAADVRDVSNRVLQVLTGREADVVTAQEPIVIAADDLAPSETAQLDKSKVLAFVTSGGSASSHTAIFARTMGIPAVIGLREQLKAEYEGRMAIVNGTAGELTIDPDEESVRNLREKQRKEEARKKLLELFRGRPTETKDGRKLLLYANIGSPRDVDAVLHNDAEGIGLYRSEFLYLESNDYPTEEVQFEAYKAVVERMGGKRVVIRTLDIGADKQADYFQLPKEENPALGMRAVRICLTRPQVFKTQLRAIYRASAFGKAAIMIPMIASVSEVGKVKEIIAEVQAGLRDEGRPFDPDMEVGIMIETPAAALISDKLAPLVDFFSVGTNDLTQYTLAVDRQNSALAPFCDTHHEAVLKLIGMAAENAHRAGIWIGICGELGADPTLTETFLRMGIDELSVSPSAVLGLRAKISEIDLSPQNAD